MNRRPSKSRSGYDAFSPEHTSHFTASAPDHRFFEPRRRSRPGRRILLLIVLSLVLILVPNFVVNRFVHVSRVSVPIRGLTEAFEGYTILHVSDLKGALFGSDQRLVRFALRDASFDAVVMTGDMVSSRGNAQPLYALIEVLRELNPDAPIYFIAGDDDPEPVSMDYAPGGSPFAPWVLGARQRGAQLLSAPVGIEQEGQTLWLTTSNQLSLDIDAMQGQFELRYLNAQAGGDENEIELAAYNLGWLEQTRIARAAMRDTDAIIAVTHVPPSDEEILRSSGTPYERVGLVLCGHDLGGLIRLPVAGPVFVPSQSLPRYGLFPGANTVSGLRRAERTWVYTSPGLGSGDAHYPSLFFRLFNPPTVTLLSLTPSSL